MFLDGYEADLFKVGMMIDTTELDPMTFVLSGLDLYSRPEKCEEVKTSSHL